MPTKPHFVVDPPFPHSKEVLSIPRRYRLAAIGAWTVAGAWSTENLTDGLIPVQALEELGVTPHLADCLIDATLWTRVTREGPVSLTWALREGPVSHLQVANWGKWQKTKREWRDGAAGNAQRQADYRKRWSKTNNGNHLPEHNALHSGSELSASNNGLPERNALCVTQESNSREERGVSREVSPVGNGTGTQPPLQEFSDHCPTHRHNPDPPPCRACGDTRRANEGAAKQRVQADYFARAAAAERRRNCHPCHGTGLIPAEGSDPFEYDTVQKCPYCNQEDQ